MTRRVAITGIGAVRSICKGVEPFWDSICNLELDTRPIPETYKQNHKWKSLFHVPAPIPDIERYEFHPLFVKAMDKTSLLTVDAAGLALEDGGFNFKREGHTFSVEGIESGAVYIGVGVNNLHAAVVAQNTNMFGHDKKLLEDYGFPTKYPTMSAVNVMANAPAAWTSILFGIKGENFCLNSACSSGTYAIGEAFRKIKDGYYDAAVAGGAECLEVPYGATMRSFDVLSALTKSPVGNPEPFSKNRSGFLFGEGGSAVIILEELEKAQKRGAKIYAEIVDYCSNSDAYNIVQLKEGSESIKSMLMVLSNGRKIDYLNSHGTGTELNDRIESEIIQQIFGDIEHQPAINSTKGILGHTVGASGAFEAAVTALSIHHQKVHGSLISDPIENLNMVHKTSNLEINYAVSTSYGFGGHNAGILFKKFEG